MKNDEDNPKAFIELMLFEDKSGDKMYFNWGSESEFSDDSFI
eukprot:CAMPEP_0114583740 /NCGR_PEP_ID=MMETSP0125-20121206/7435_1 /TAXON_ID=485358 ORGANISM="Aristerostoma sp., Strain ATCC 50986" /NCGR_SAMPLE_ID=MMETSP0125 /ASSEMBLY_ACC=CAM_ASM_000245 /LENGTH=41 /DNA_ID= /DNA_START= /DNA_END= /DNA_ORIENTATION=